jgi:hypothetical protein
MVVSPVQGGKMKVLVYGNRKQDDDLYDISTPEKEDAAFLLLFKTLDEDWGVYTDLNLRERELHQQAKAGDGKAAKKLMSGRQRYEYENFRIDHVQDPLEIK